MLHLNISPDLEIAIRKMCAESGRSVTNMCDALMRLGMKATPAEIDAACVASVRPMGRPSLNVPSLAGVTTPQTAPQSGLPQVNRDMIARALARRAKRKK